MVRLLIPLVLLTLFFWGVLYAIPKRKLYRQQLLGAAKQFTVAIGLAVAVLVVVSSIFFLGSFVHVS